MVSPPAQFLCTYYNFGAICFSLGSYIIKQSYEPGMVTNVFYLSTQEAETKGSLQDQGLSGLHIQSPSSRPAKVV